MNLKKSISTVATLTPTMRPTWTTALTSVPKARRHSPSNQSASSSLPTTLEDHPSPWLILRSACRINSTWLQSPMPSRHPTNRSWTHQPSTQRASASSHSTPPASQHQSLSQPKPPPLLLNLPPKAGFLLVLAPWAASTMTSLQAHPTCISSEPRCAKTLSSTANANTVMR